MKTSLFKQYSVAISAVVVYTLFVSYVIITYAGLPLS